MNPILLDMSENVIIALISGGTGIITAVIGSIGALHATAKKDRAQQQANNEKQREDLKQELIKYHEKNREEIREIREKDLREMREDIASVREDVTAMGANLQQKIAVVEVEVGHTRSDVNTLSARVEKHNGVIERTYRLEETDKLLEEKIKVANHRIEDLERKV